MPRSKVSTSSPVRAMRSFNFRSRSFRMRSSYSAALLRLRYRWNKKGVPGVSGVSGEWKPRVPGSERARHHRRPMTPPTSIGWYAPCPTPMPGRFRPFWRFKQRVWVQAQSFPPANCACALFSVRAAMPAQTSPAAFHFRDARPDEISESDRRAASEVG